MNLDELLTRAGSVDAPSSDLLDRIEGQLAASAHADLARRAVLVRRRRIARIGSAVVGVGAAAAVVATVALQPSARTPTPQVKTPTPVTPHFTTVAQVINAAAAATPNVDPTAAPYWRTVVSWHSFGTWPLPDGTSCNVPSNDTATVWNGNGRPGVSMIVGNDRGHDNGKPIAVPEERPLIDGQALTWRQINAGHWTAAQIATMVADSGPSGKDGRPPAAYYVFKNTAEMLMSAPASPAIRKALWQNLAALPGVHLDGRVKDALGREGWQLSYTPPTAFRGSGVETAIVDPGSGVMLQGSVSFPQNSAPSVETLVSAAPAATAPEPQPEWSPPPAPTSKGVPPIKRLTRSQLLEQTRRQADQPVPYPTCAPGVARF